MYDRSLWQYIRFFENPVDFINSPVYRDGCEFSVIFPENPVGLTGMHGEQHGSSLLKSSLQSARQAICMHAVP